MCCLLIACGSAQETIEAPVRWRLAQTSCQELGGARVVVEAGGLGVLVHGPCEQTEFIRMSIPAGERFLRATLWDYEDRVVASGTAPVGAVVVMRADPQVRGSLWLWPHLGGVAGCDVLGVDRYHVTLSRSWGDQEQRLVACSEAGDLMLDHLWPGSWQIRIDARSVEGLVLGSSTSVRRIEPGQRRPSGEEPLRLDLTPSAQPQGRVQVGFRRLDQSIADCDQVGIDRLVIKARQLGSTREVEFSRNCDELLPEWSRLLNSPGSVEVLVEGFQDEQILYRGTWTLRFVPTRVMPALVLEPL